MVPIMRPLIVILLALASMPSIGKEPPNSVDLLAAYCLTMSNSIRASIPSADNPGPANSDSVRDLDVRIQRFGAYVGLRLAQVDPLAMLVAVNNAKGDFSLYAAFAQENLKRSDQCIQEGNAQKDCVAEYSERRQKSDVAVRVERCNVTDWLPL
jgi:hypothetical protein